ncbi:MAG: bifunctional diguanylate cyclase/phosphodiesterase [Oscillospiraceae bacterium]|jgi:diguanylate cyclase (GGDEF)-like protein|nr:bifunctional diguanylate cyclase/phosphodiesterase [Oscillospiraceae bacterium]
MALFGKKEKNNDSTNNIPAPKKGADYTDTLTGARTQKSFLEDGNRLLSEHTGLAFSVIQINIRNFKYVNDVYGEAEGDEILRRLVKLIADGLTDNEMYGRLKDDNFVVLLVRTNFAEVLRWFTELNKSLKAGIGTSVMFDLYAGIFFPHKNKRTDLQEMMQNANMAIRAAGKEKKQYVIFNESMKIDVSKETMIVKNMSTALESDEFTFYLQPQHNIRKDDVICSAEALVRWIRADGSVVFPSDFIPVFERNGFIVELDRYLLRKVCAFLQLHENDAWAKDFSISVNVSRLGLYRADFIEYYLQQKKDYNVADGRIALEFAENAVFDDFDLFKDMILRLKAEGYKCSLDDFGAGSSSLNVLKELPVDYLKMDRRFFAAADDVKQSNAVIGSVVALAHGLSMQVIAQGIEDKPQIEHLRTIGCDIVQGYVFSKPLVLNEFVEYASNFVSQNMSTSRKTVSKTEVPIEDKFKSLLRTINSLCVEIDLDSEKYSVLSTNDGEFYVPSRSGDWESFAEGYATNAPTPEFQELFTKECNYDGIYNFYFGTGEEKQFDFQARVFMGSQGGFSGKKEWYRVTLRKIITEQNKKVVLFLIKNINDGYENENLANKLQAKLDIIIRGIKGIIYDISIKSDSISLVQNNSGFPAVIGNGKFTEKIKLYIEQSISPDDRQKFVKVLSKAFLQQFLFGETTSDYSFDYTEVRRDGTERKKTAQFIKKEDKVAPGLTLIIKNDA